MPSPVELACLKLKAAGLRITQPRLAILAALIKRGLPTSSEALHDELGANACDVVTVYRCMAAFEAIGLVRRVFLVNGTSLYEIDLGDPARYHVVCKESRTVEVIDHAVATELTRVINHIEELLRSKGYGEVGHLVEFFGISPTDKRNPVSVSVPETAVLVPPQR